MSAEPPAPAERAAAELKARRKRKKRRAKLAARVGGLPIAVRGTFLRGDTPDRIVRAAYARHYWRNRDASDWLDLALALALWPVIVLTLAFRFTARNGAVIARREGRPAILQFLDQVRLYLASGALPPWYYIHELYRRPTGAHARSFIYRWESKGGVFPLLREQRPPASLLSDKVEFAERCRSSGVAAAPILGVARNCGIDWLRPGDDASADWFVKPVVGKGGTGIERWDHVGGDRFRNPAGETLERDALLERIATKTEHGPCFIQPRVENIAELADLNNGALATIRALTCLDEQGDPELTGAVMRMAVGSNRVVDNFHKGGIAAAVDLATGELGPASNLGLDARLGWLDRHPDSGAQIRGRRLPRWDEFVAFVEKAHRAFDDRILIGWDVAITANGPVVVEANGSPDLDIMQRIPRRGLMPERFGELLAHHVKAMTA